MSLHSRIKFASTFGLMVILGMLFVCFSYYARARIELGYWPTYGNPDPKQLDWPIHHVVVLIGLLSIAPALIWSGLFSLVLIGMRYYRWGLAIMISVAAVCFGLGQIADNPAVDEFLGWYAD